MTWNGTAKRWSAAKSVGVLFDSVTEFESAEDATPGFGTPRFTAKVGVSTKVKASTKPLSATGLKRAAPQSKEVPPDGLTRCHIRTVETLGPCIGHRLTQTRALPIRPLPSDTTLQSASSHIAHNTPRCTQQPRRTHTDTYRPTRAYTKLTNTPIHTQHAHQHTHQHTHTPTHKQKQQQQQYNLGRLRFNKRGASTPLWRVEACSHPSRQPNPIPAIPPCVEKTPHLHGAPTTEETSFVKP